MNRPFLLLVAASVVASLLAPGCSVMHSWKETAAAGDVGRIREQRREAAVRDFERRRAMAQLQAAQQRAEHGDPEAAERTLLDVLGRDADNIDAHAQLAELYWAHERWAEAEQHLREAAKLAPDRADLHHSLGLVLDARGDTGAAHDHLAQAAQLEPANPLYQLAAESAP